MQTPLTLKAPLVLALIRESFSPGTGKSQHRVLLDPQPEGFDDANGMRHEPQVFRWADPAERHRVSVGAVVLKQEMPWQTGDLLWVRETIQRDNDQDLYRYAADNEPVTAPVGERFWQEQHPRPRSVQARSCPMWASRLTLVVEETDIQRLGDISASDAVREGMVYDGDKAGWVMPGMDHPAKGFSWLSRPSPYEMFAASLDVLHGSGEWLRNKQAWVAVARFSVKRQNVASLA